MFRVNVATAVPPLPMLGLYFFLCVAHWATRGSQPNQSGAEWRSTAQNGTTRSGLLNNFCSQALNRAP